MTDDDFSDMTLKQADKISSAQFDAIDPAQQQILIDKTGILAQAQTQAQNGEISYIGMLNVLEAAKVGGMNAIKFAALEQLNDDLQTSQGLTTSAYVAQIVDDVIAGNSANSYWNGGSSTATPLGDLSARSSQAQFDDLIGKWFLGADLPSLALPPSTGASKPSAYQPVSMPLFGAGGPSYLDVNQGDVGDCYFLAALAETALTDPSLIERMISRNSNGTYSVLFHVDGQDDYVTVNDQLPVLQDGYAAANGSTLQFDNSTTLWSPLIEKAYAQLMAQTEVTPGSTLGVNANSYAATSGGGGNEIVSITGQIASYTPIYSGSEGDDALLFTPRSPPMTTCWSAPATPRILAVSSTTICSKS